MFVHYVGRLAEDGREFDSSRARGNPFSFTLGKGHVIRGWDLGVATMRLGETCVLRCGSAYAYGERGSGPKIPGGATLEFEVELLRWKSGADLTEDGLVKRSPVPGLAKQDGEGAWEKAGPGDKVLIGYVARWMREGQPDVLVASSEAAGGEPGAEEGTLSKSVAEVTPVVLDVSAGAWCEALALGAKEAKKRQGVRVTVDGGNYHRVVPGRGFTVSAMLGAGWEEGVDEANPFVVDVFVHEIMKVTRVTAAEGGVVMKTRVREGDEDDHGRPREEGKVRIAYRLVSGAHAPPAGVEEGAPLEVRTEDAPLECVVDEEHMCCGLEEAVRTMKRGEVADVSCDADSLAADEVARRDPLLSAQVARGEGVRYLGLTLVGYENPPDNFTLTPDERVVRSDAAKEAAAAFFKAGDFRRAAKRYERALKPLNVSSKNSDADTERAKLKKVALLNNLALCAYKLGEYDGGEKGCVARCGEVLRIEPGNVKAKFRRAGALRLSGDFEGADRDLAGLERTAEGGGHEDLERDLRRERQLLKHALAAQNKKDAALFKKMFK